VHDKHFSNQFIEERKLNYISTCLILFICHLIQDTAERIKWGLGFSYFWIGKIGFAWLVGMTDTKMEIGKLLYQLKSKETKNRRCWTFHQL
jgi:hypothetical protein